MEMGQSLMELEQLLSLDFVENGIGRGSGRVKLLLPRNQSPIRRVPILLTPVLQHCSIDIKCLFL
jgi:hypothetical protein